MRAVSKKRAKEKKVVAQMIRIYCNDHHREKCLCEDCEELLAYAHRRIDLCPFMESKTFCSNCRVHCYEKTKREQIKAIMRYSGPRMLLHHPLMAVHHVISSIQEKRRLEREK